MAECTRCVSRLERERERECVSVCVCVCVCLCVCVCARARACVSHNEKKVPDEWQARQAIPAILQVSSSKHNTNNNTTRGRGPFHQSTLSSLQEKKEKQLYYMYLTNPTHVAVYLFRNPDRDRIDFKDESGSQGQYRE